MSDWHVMLIEVECLSCEPARPARCHFARAIASVFAVLSGGQEPLGEDFEAVWDANVDTLYES